MTLEEFIKEMQRDISAFKKYWLDQHNANPNMFPLEMPDDDTGSWFEHFIVFFQ